MVVATPDVEWIAGIVKKHTGYTPSQDKIHIREKVQSPPAYSESQNDVVVDSPDGKLVLRYRPEGDAGTDDVYFGGRTNAAKEAHMHGVLQGLIPGYLPKLLGWDSDYLLERGVDGESAASLFKRRGKTLENGVTMPLLDDVVQYAGQLGAILAHIHQKTLDKFGSIQPSGIENGKPTWAERFETIFERHYENPVLLDVLSKDDMNLVKELFEQNRSILTDYEGPARLVIYNRHPGNATLDSQGNVVAIHDLRMGEAAHPSLEFGSLIWNVFGLRGNDDADKIYDVFMSTYKQEGGPCQDDDDLELPFANHLLSAIENYGSMSDPKRRDKWVPRFKETVETLLREKEIDLSRIY